MILALVALVIIITIGYLTMRIVNSPLTNTLFEELPYDFAVGLGVISLQMFIYSRLGISWDRLLLILPWALVAVVLYLKTSLAYRNNFFPKIKINIYGKVMLIISLLLIVFTCFEALIRPVSAWDGWAIWLLKSKIFFIDGNIKDSIFHYVNSEYPIIISLAGTFFYTLLGKVDDTSVLILFFAFYLFLGITFFSELRRQIGDNFALLFTFLLLGTQNILRHGGRYEAGQADLALAFYIFLTMILVTKYIKKRDKRMLIIINLLLGITALIKYEGLPFSITMQAVLWFVIIKKGDLAHLITSGIWLLIVLDWQFYKVTHNLPQNYILRMTSFHLERAPVIAMSLVKELLNITRWNFVWVAFFVSLIGGIKKKKYAIYYLTIFFQVGFYIMIYFLTPLQYEGQINSSLDRLLIHVTPVVIFVTALEVHSSILQKKEEKGFE